MASDHEILEWLENIKVQIRACYVQVKELREHRLNVFVGSQQNHGARAAPTSSTSGSTQQNEQYPADVYDGGGTLAAGLQNEPPSVDDSLLLSPEFSGFLQDLDHTIESQEKTLTRILSCITDTAATFTEKIPAVPARGRARTIGEEEATGARDVHDDGQESGPPRDSESTSGPEALSAVEVGRVEGLDVTGKSVDPPPPNVHCTRLESKWFDQTS